MKKWVSLLAMFLVVVMYVGHEALLVKDFFNEDLRKYKIELLLYLDARAKFLSRSDKRPEDEVLLRDMLVRLDQWRYDRLDFNAVPVLGPFVPDEWGNTKNPPGF